MATLVEKVERLKDTEVRKNNHVQYMYQINNLGSIITSHKK